MFTKKRQKLLLSEKKWEHLKNARVMQAVFLYGKT